jgi:hypothetical protein
MILFPPVLGGLEVIVCSWIPESEEVLRPWLERWFTLPWRPLRRTKIVPVPCVICNGKLLVRPERLAGLQDAINRFNANLGGGL